MDKDLKAFLIRLLNKFNSREINEYFSNDFIDDWKWYFNNPKVYPKMVEVLQYLNDTFYDIDVIYRDTDKFEEMVKETIEKAIEMLN